MKVRAVKVFRFIKINDTFTLIYFILLIMTHPTDILNFNKLYNDYYQQFVRFAMGYVRDEAKAQDFVSDAFAAYWESKATLISNTNAQGYILTIVRNKCLNYLQHKKIKLRAIEELTDHAQWLLNTKINTLEACNPDKIFSQEIQQIIENTINKQPQRTAQIFRMSRFEQLTHREIAENVKLSTKSVEYHISKVLAELRIQLKDFIITILILFSFIY